MIETYSIGKVGGPTLTIDDCSWRMNLRRLQWLPLGTCFWVAALIDEAPYVWRVHCYSDEYHGLRQRLRTFFRVTWRYSKSRSGGGLPWGTARNIAVNVMLLKERRKYEGALAWQKLLDSFVAAEKSWLDFTREIEELEANIEKGRALIQTVKEGIGHPQEILGAAREKR